MIPIRTTCAARIRVGSLARIHLDTPYRISQDVKMQNELRRLRQPNPCGLRDLSKTIYRMIGMAGWAHLPGLVRVTILSVSGRALDSRWNPELKLRRLRPCAPVMGRWGVEHMEYGTFSLHEIIIIP